MRFLPPVLVALALMACGATTEPPEDALPLVSAAPGRGEASGGASPAPPEMTTTTVDAEAVALWGATVLWNDTVRWNEAVAQNEREAAEATTRRYARDTSSYASYASTIGPDNVPCGGDLPSCCIVARESGGVWTALNPRSIDGHQWGAGGAYQFIVSTWLAYGGGQYAPAAHLASPSAQIAVARAAWADYPQHWSPLC